MTRLGLLLVFSAFGCGGGDAPPGGPARVVSLVPSVTETVFRIGAGDRLVGNTTYCDYPAAARRVYKVGDFVNPDIERIVSLRPSLVFLSLPVHRMIADKLGELGIDCYVSAPATVEGVLDEIDSVGTLLGAGDRARLLTDSLRARLALLAPPADTPDVYVEVSATPLMSAGGRTFLSSVIARAGGHNIFADVDQDYPAVDPEQIIRADPDVVLVLHPEAGAHDVAGRLGWDRVAAVRYGRVYDDLDPDLLVRPGPRVVDGIEILARRLHPERG